jgi:hypothetical protein
MCLAKSSTSNFRTAIRKVKGATMNNNLDNVAADQFHASRRGYNVRSPWMRNMLIFSWYLAQD